MHCHATAIGLSLLLCAFSFGCKLSSSGSNHNGSNNQSSGSATKSNPAATNSPSDAVNLGGMGLVVKEEEFFLVATDQSAPTRDIVGCCVGIRIIPRRPKAAWPRTIRSLPA